jgi:hypothetical protein
MAAKFTRLTHKIVIQLHLVAESSTICSSRSMRPVRKLLVTLSYFTRFVVSVWGSCRRWSKAITLETVGVLRDWRYSSTHSLTSALRGGEWAASHPGRFTPRERTPGTFWIGGWLGPRAGLDTVVEKKFLARTRTPDHPARSPAL